MTLTVKLSGEAINYHHGTVIAPPSTPTLTLTPNPKAPPSPPLRIFPLLAGPTDPSPGHTSRPWTPADDQELISMKQDTKSRPSWEMIGARLHRDPQVCKMRWGILKQTPGVMDQPDRMNPPHEPEGEDWPELWNPQCQKCVTCRFVCVVVRYFRASVPVSFHGLCRPLQFLFLFFFD